MQKKSLRQGGVGLMALSVLGAAATGCLTRDVATGAPATKLSVTAAQDNRRVNKIDLLFGIDDSSSMSDKQKFLADAVPTLLTRLVSPNCVDDASRIVAKVSGACPTGSKFEFEPITDIHVGVVSSSLGTSGSDGDVNSPNSNICPPNNPKLNRRAELWAPTAPPATAPKTEPSRFLAWYPDATRDFPTVPPSQAYKTAGDLIGAFTKFFGDTSGAKQDENVAIGQSGCGMEAQLESVYQFLIAPDPYKDFADRGDAFNGVTNTVRTGMRDSVLKQRKDFLRPDSLVAVIMLTDENDASIDPEVFFGGGGRFGSFGFGSTNTMAQSTKPKSTPYSGTGGKNGLTFPKPTAACASLKNASADVKAKCTSCADPRITASTNPECADPHYEQEDDALNARFTRMQQRFGLDPLFPISRYVRGLSSAKVPKRSEEHDPSGQYLVEAGTCTNPLFAAELPSSSSEELCELTPGNRTAELVYFAIIGGVPQDLLRNNDGTLKPNLSENDWVRILGKNPGAFDFDGIDPRMYELGRPRTAEELAAQSVLANPAGIEGVYAAQEAAGKKATDPDFVIKDRNTNIAGKEAGFGADLNYACTFTLGTQRGLEPADIAGVGDCNKHYGSEACSPSTKWDPTPANGKQIRAKAYPTTRELQLARALGTRGIAASLCPLKVTSANPSQDPDYGYNPAVKSIVDRLADFLNARCLSQVLKPTSEPGQQVTVNCAMYEIVAEGTPAQDGDCAARTNRAVGNPGILARFRESLKDEGSTEQANKQICLLKQLPVLPGETCLNNTEQGWCYVQANGSKTPAGKCTQAVVFQQNTVVNGSPVRIQCVTE